MKSLKNKPKRQLKTKPADKVEDVPVDGPIKPEDQLILSPDELEEVYGNALLIKEPPEPNAQVIYSYKNKKFQSLEQKSKFIPLINLKSSLLHYESTEANIQTENELCRVPEDLGLDDKESAVEMMGEEEAQFDNDMIDLNIPMEEEVNEEFSIEENKMDEMIEMDEDEQTLVDKSKDIGEAEDESIVSSKTDSVQTFESLPMKKMCSVIKLKNKFNFFDRSASTEKVVQRDKETQTIPTVKVDLFKYASQSVINDAYMEDFSKQQEEKEREKRERMAAHMNKKHVGKSHENDSTKQNGMDQKLLKTTGFFEKIINLNATDAIAQDFRYYEDPSDQFRGREGTLLPMWTMVFDEAKHLFVTDISWSPDYFDMFAVTLGIPQGHLPLTENPDLGYVCLWSLKNSSYPEYIAQTHCGAICLDIHHEHGYMLVVGLRDGHLAVYNVSAPTKTPQYTTDSIHTKHMGCVRQVVWRKDLPSGELNFFSVSEDGTVCHWILMQHEMIKTVKMSLLVDMYPEVIIGGIAQTYYARGTTITFHRTNEELYSVGTVEGYIFKCNTEWTSFVQRFKAHEMTVNRINYNEYNADIYLTCSDDCVVKLWEEKSDVPLITFDLQSSVTDVRWSPFSGTIFCAITVDCYVIFYDLDADLNDNICKQPVQPANEYQLSRVVLNKRVSLVLIGSSRSTVVTLKLSPNLRTIMKPPKKGVQLSTEEMELEKLSKALESTREPTVESVHDGDDGDVIVDF